MDLFPADIWAHIYGFLGTRHHYRFRDLDEFCFLTRMDTVMDQMEQTTMPLRMIVNGDLTEKCSQKSVAMLASDLVSKLIRLRMRKITQHHIRFQPFGKPPLRQVLSAYRHYGACYIHIQRGDRWWLWKERTVCRMPE